MKTEEQKQRELQRQIIRDEYIKDSDWKEPLIRKWIMLRKRRR